MGAWDIAKGVLSEPARDLADWWDGQKRETEKELEDWVVKNPNWFAVVTAAKIQTAMEVGQGTVDVLRLGEGVEEGTFGGVVKDALRLVSVVAPTGAGSGTVARSLRPLAQGGRLRLAVQVSGEAPCTYQAVNNALAITKGKKGLFLPMFEFLKLANGKAAKMSPVYNVGAYIDDLLPAIKKTGSKVKEITGLKTIDDVIKVAKNESAPVIFAVVMKVKNAAGVVEEVGHSVIAYRGVTGRVRFADYGGKFANSFDELMKKFAPLSKPVLTSKPGGMSAAVVNAMEFNGAWSRKVAGGVILQLAGWKAFEGPDGVDLGLPVITGAGLPKLHGDNATLTTLPGLPSVPPIEVIKGSFQAYKARKRGGRNVKLSGAAAATGRLVAPKVEFLEGVQFRLNALGFASGAVDGMFGPITRKAVEAFQRSSPPLRVDGIPGPNTQRALSEACGY